MPRLPASGLRGLVARPHVRLAAAALALLVALSMVIVTLRPRPAGDVRLSLAEALAQAPSGWRHALKPADGPHLRSVETIRLWDRPPGAAPAAPVPRTALAADPTGPLPQAPVAGLFAPGPGGPLPIIAADGRTPFDVYRRGAAPDGRPRVGLIVRGLGLDAQLTRRAIEDLPPQVTLSFAVYAENLQDWIDQARARGHEVLLETPMEPANYPDNDPGPYTLMAMGTPAEINQKLEWVLSRAAGYFGVMNAQGGRFLATPAATAALTTALRGRGLAFFDDGQGRGLAPGGLRASATRALDAQVSPAAVDEALAGLEGVARAGGAAVAVGAAYPMMLDRALTWAQGLDARGLQLAPASAFVARQ